MSHDPTPVGDESGGKPIIQLAVHAIRAFGTDVDRDTAARLLPLWAHYPELIEDDVAAVLDRFGPEPEQDVKRMRSYSPGFLLEDVLALLRMHGVHVEMSGYEKVRKPNRAARELLKALHVRPKWDSWPANWWLKGSYGKRLVPPTFV